MIRFKKRRLQFYIKIALIMVSIIAAKYLSNDLEAVWARSNVKTIGKTFNQDTIHGKIVDSVTNEPIPFATISFYKSDSNFMTFVTDAKGEFSTDEKYLQSKVKISAIGYKAYNCYFTNNHNNLVLLGPANNILPNVIVSSKAHKKPNATKIIKKVNKNIKQNYGDFSFDQRFKIYSTLNNYDTTKSEMIDFVDINFVKNNKSLIAPKWRQDTLKYDAIFFKLIGVPCILTGNIIAYSDIIRKELVISEKRIKNFDFKLQGHFQDKKFGSVFIVSFKPISTYNDFFLQGYTLTQNPLGYLKGEMIIREEDYAVVNLKYIWELKNDRLNAALVSSYHSPNWKADKLGKIIANSVIYNYEYSYAKDSVAGKYFVQTIKVDCHNTGYQIENHQKVQLYYQFEAINLGIKNIIE